VTLQRTLSRRRRWQAVALALGLVTGASAGGQEAAPEEESPDKLVPGGASVTVPPSFLGTQEPPPRPASTSSLDIDAVNALIRAHNGYVEAGDNDRALQAAGLLRDMFEARYGEGAEEVIPWVTVHALAYARLNRHTEARRTFERAVFMTERYEGPFSERLVEILPSQARTLDELGEVKAAESALLRAKFITHRRRGINNLEQLGVVRQLRALYLRNYALEEAEREQMFIMRVYERAYGDSPQVVEGLDEHARYYMSIGDYQSALDVYRRSLEILEAAYGESDPRLIPPLRGIAQTYLRRDIRRGEGERALKRVVGIYDAQETSDVFDHALSLRDLGDWHIRAEHPEDARQVYEEAWKLLVEADGGDDARARTLLGKPVALTYVSPPEIYDSPDERSFLSPDRYLETSFRVLPNGRTKDAQVVGGNAERRTQFENLKQLRYSKFRPAMLNGALVATTVTWRQYYSGPGE
jgi:tetratricopeptide (TPR) repeat protein